MWDIHFTQHAVVSPQNTEHGKYDPYDSQRSGTHPEIPQNKVHMTVGHQLGELGDLTVETISWTQISSDGTLPSLKQGAHSSGSYASALTLLQSGLDPRI